MLNRIIAFGKKNQGLVVAVLASAVMAGLAVGCQPSVTSPISGESVTRTQLAQEVTEHNLSLQEEQRTLEADIATSRITFEHRAAELQQRSEVRAEAIDNAVAELVRQEEAIANGFNLVTGLVTDAAGPYGPLAVAAFGVLALGLGIDNRRKDGVIKGQKMVMPVASA